MQKLLQSMKVEQYDPRVVNMLMEFMHRYVSQVMREAVVYAEHAGRTEPEVDDVRLAIQSRVDTSFTQPPPRDFFVELAKTKNNVVLPKIDFRPGIRLPPEQHCLINPNLQFPEPNQPFIQGVPRAASTQHTQSTPRPAAAQQKRVQIKFQQGGAAAAAAAAAPGPTPMQH
mmetsp:Transcript_28780/g.67952  ORF Transcript_28780/g.67952 Transcript_28780/m.67952 type:complete len:171 (-) Transcript_28780:29-541(-)